MQGIFKNIDRNTLFSTLLFFSFIFDSGGGLGLRNIGFMLMLMVLFYELCFNYGKQNTNKYFLLFYCGSLVFLLSTKIIALSNHATFASSSLQNFSLYFLLPLYILAKNRYLTIEGYLKSVCIFCIIVLMFFFGRILGVAPIVQLFGFVATRADGFLGYAYFDNAFVVFPNVYFQGTLAIVPAAVIMISQQKFKAFALVMLTLFVAPSRFGVLVCIMFFLILYIKKIYIFLLGSTVFVLCIMIFEIPVFIDFLDMFDLATYGHAVRAGHMESILFLFNSNLSYFIVGQGPGTMFYSLGFNGYTDSVEISHFDFVRRYGIIYFIILNTAFFFLVYRLFNKSTVSRQLVYGLLAHYIVAISNPVLVSLPFMMFLSICIVINESNKNVVV